MRIPNKMPQIGINRLVCPAFLQNTEVEVFAVNDPFVNRENTAVEVLLSTIVSPSRTPCATGWYATLPRGFLYGGSVGLDDSNLYFHVKATTGGQTTDLSKSLWVAMEGNVG